MHVTRLVTNGLGR